MHYLGSSEIWLKKGGGNLHAISCFFKSGKITTLNTKKNRVNKGGGELACHFDNFLISAKKGGDLAGGRN